MASSSTAGGDYLDLGWPMGFENPAPTLAPSAPPSNTSESTNSSSSTPQTTTQQHSTDSSNKQPTLEDLPTADAPEEDEDKRNESIYECTICLETAKDAVVSMCGHLFCWPCLHQWLETRPTRQLCPVCKAAISKDKVIPLYGRDSKNQQDPRSKIPPRPVAQRVEPESTGFQAFGLPELGFQMSFGIGAFPFGFFSSSFNFGSDVRPPHMGEDEQFISKLFLWVGILMLTWLILS